MSGIIVSNRVTCSNSERGDFGEEAEDKERELELRSTVYLRYLE